MCRIGHVEHVQSSHRHCGVPFPIENRDGISPRGPIDQCVGSHLHQRMGVGFATPQQHEARPTEVPTEDEARLSVGGDIGGMAGYRSDGTMRDLTGFKGRKPM